MFKSIGFKVSATIFSILLISFVVVWFVLNLDFKKYCGQNGAREFGHHKYFGFSNYAYGYEFGRS
nr:hypothetical protein [Campylobacter upsaliensis]